MMNGFSSFAKGLLDTKSQTVKNTNRLPLISLQLILSKTCIADGSQIPAMRLFDCRECSAEPLSFFLRSDCG